MLQCGRAFTTERLGVLNAEKEKKCSSTYVLKYIINAIDEKGAFGVSHACTTKKKRLSIHCQI